MKVVIISLTQPGPEILKQLERLPGRQMWLRYLGGTNYEYVMHNAVGLYRWRNVVALTDLVSMATISASSATGKNLPQWEGLHTAYEAYFGVYFKSLKTKHKILSFKRAT